jgi:hypothetical protein
MISPGGLGVEARGKAPHWRLTEEWCLGKTPTRDFLLWDGTVFEPKEIISPSRKSGATLAPKVVPLAKRNAIKIRKPGLESGAIHAGHPGSTTGAITSLTTPLAAAEARKAKQCD